MIQTVSASLQSPDASTLEQSSTRLRDAMVAFSQLVKRFSSEDWTPALRERAQNLDREISLVRDQLARLSVLNQHRTEGSGACSRRQHLREQPARSIANRPRTHLPRCR